MNNLNFQWHSDIFPAPVKVALVQKGPLDVLINLIIVFYDWLIVHDITKKIDILVDIFTLY